MAPLTFEFVNSNTSPMKQKVELTNILRKQNKEYQGRKNKKTTH